MKAVLKPSLMTEAEFNRMAAMEEEAKEGIAKAAIRGLFSKNRY